jgi:hypothetical protein
LVLSPTGSINLGFITKGRLAAVLITPSLGVPNWSVIYINTAPSVVPRGRVQKLFPAPCRRGESSPEAFFITMPAFKVMRE